MSEFKVWIKKRNSDEQAFEVDCKKGVDFDDLKEIIPKKKKFNAEYVMNIYSMDSDDQILAAGLKVPMPKIGEIGCNDKHPYYFSTRLASQADWATLSAHASVEWSTNKDCVRILGDDISGPHSTAIIVGRKAVLACVHSLNTIFDVVVDDQTKIETTRYHYLEDYWIQSRVTKNKRGEFTDEGRVRIKLYKFSEENDWALFERADQCFFQESEVAVIDTSLLTNPNFALTHKHARVLHCPVSLFYSIKKVRQFSIGYQIAAVSVQGESSHHVKYEGRSLCTGSSGGAVFVYPSGNLLGMHCEAINEVDFDVEEEPVKSIAHNNKRVSSEDNPYEYFEKQISEEEDEQKPKKMKTDSETIASIAGGMNGLGSALIVCKFPRLMHYIRELNNPDFV